LIAQHFCAPHYIEPQSKWTSFYLQRDNLGEAIRFARISYHRKVTGKSFLNAGGSFDNTFKQ
jgi:hypothetical protein